MTTLTESEDRIALIAPVPDTNPATLTFERAYAHMIARKNHVRDLLLSGSPMPDYPYNEFGEPGTFLDTYKLPIVLTLARESDANPVLRARLHDEVPEDKIAWWRENELIGGFSDNIPDLLFNAAGWMMTDAASKALDPDPPVTENTCGRPEPRLHLNETFHNRFEDAADRTMTVDQMLDRTFHHGACQFRFSPDQEHIDNRQIAASEMEWAEETARNHMIHLKLESPVLDTPTWRQIGGRLQTMLASYDKMNAVPTGNFTITKTETHPDDPSITIYMINFQTWG